MLYLLIVLDVLMSAVAGFLAGALFGPALLEKIFQALHEWRAGKKP